MTKFANRESKRNYIRKYKRDANAIYCPRCGFKTVHYALPAEEEGNSNVTCEVCQYTTYKNVSGLKSMEQAKAPEVRRRVFGTQ